MKHLLIAFSLLLSSHIGFSRVIISEIMYHPAVEDTSMDDGLFEFLEIANIADTSLDISGYLIESGVIYLFPQGSILAPNEHIVLVSDPISFASRYPGITPFGTYSGRLNNGGETISLINSLGTSITKVDYNDASPWPSIADGFGFSLVPIDENSSLSQKDADYWSTSTVINGSPGQASIPSNQNFQVYINEVLSSPTVTGNDRVELYNDGDENVDISYWYLTDNRNNPKKYRFPQGTVINSKGFFTIDEFTINPFDLGFSFSSKGDQTYIFSADIDSNLTGYSHGFSYQAQYNDVSFGRYENSLGDEYFTKQASQTFGNQNSTPVAGPLVIEKIMYEPSIWENEFLTIRNVTLETQLLYNPNFPDSNEYKVTGIDFKFPYGSNISLEADEYLILVNDDPGTFRVNYNIPSEIQVFQFYNSLSNAGENIALESPVYRDTLTDGSFDHHYAIIDEVRYNDKTPWPNVSANSYYLQRINLTSFGTDPVNWTNSFDPLFVGINDFNNKNLKHIYPSIVSNTVTISGFKGLMDVKIINHSGMIVEEIETNKNKINLEELNPGLYIIRINNSDSFKILKE